MREEILIECNGEKKNLYRWCIELDINYETARKKYYEGELPEIILNGDTGVIINYKGKKYSVSEVEEIFGINKNTVYYRKRGDWSDEDIVETPPNEIPISKRTEENIKYGRYSFFLNPYFKNK